MRIFEHGSDDEPAIIDVASENHLAVVATNDFFIIGTEDGEVVKYSLITKKLEDILIRCSGPVRDLAISPDGQWVAVASEYVEQLHHYIFSSADLVSKRIGSQDCEYWRHEPGHVSS